MNILERIEQLIDELDSKPTSLDFGFIRTVLVDAREAVVDGLQRSKDAQNFDALKQESARLTDKATDLVGRLDSATAQIESLKNNESCLGDLFAHMKKVALGRAQILHKDPEVLSATKRTIEECNSVQRFLEINSRIEQDFEKHFRNGDHAVGLGKGSKRVIQHNHYKVGG